MVSANNIHEKVKKDNDGDIYLPAGHERSENSKELIWLHLTRVLSKEDNGIFVGYIHRRVPNFQVVEFFYSMSAELVHSGCEIVAGVCDIILFVIVGCKFLSKLLQPAAKLIIFFDKVL
jgi:hypothetical protein